MEKQILDLSLFRSGVPVNPSPSRPQVLYDGACPFCLKSVDLLRKLDGPGGLDYVDMRRLDHPVIQKLGIPPEGLLDQMHVLPPGQTTLLHGFDALRWLAWRLPLFSLLAPFLYMPGVPQLGRRLYLWIARNRFRLVPCHHGVCSIEKKPGRVTA